MLLRSLLLIGFAFLALPAAAQTASPRLQDATIHARGSTLTITRLPIKTPNGTIYRDVTIELHVDASGNVTLATDQLGHALAAGMTHAAPAGQVALSATPSPFAPGGSGGSVELAQRPSAPVIEQQFAAGTYEAADGSLVQLVNRGNDLIHGVHAWSLTSLGGGEATLTSATWYSGPPEYNPKSTRLRNAGLASAEYAYGVSDGGSSDVFGTGALLGVVQMGKILKIVSFRHGCCSDADKPVAQLSFKLVGNR